MEYRYRYRVKASDIWQVRMYYAYGSYTAVVNIICIISAVVMIATLWSGAAYWFRVAMILFLSLFTVIQPLVIYLMARNQLKGAGDELELLFNDKGIRVSQGGKSEEVLWRDVVGVSVKPTLAVIYTGDGQGYILTNRVLGKSRKDFLAFVKGHRANKR